MTKPNGGPAFPEPLAISPAGDAYPSYSGMTLRDWFAGQALAGALPFPGLVNGETNKRPPAIAQLAYEYADAMIAEREK